MRVGAKYDLGHPTAKPTSSCASSKGWPWAALLKVKCSVGPIFALNGGRTCPRGGEEDGHLLVTADADLWSPSSESAATARVTAGKGV